MCDAVGAIAEKFDSTVLETNKAVTDGQGELQCSVSKLSAELRSVIEEATKPKRLVSELSGMDLLGVQGLNDTIYHPLPGNTQTVMNIEQNHHRIYQIQRH